MLSAHNLRLAFGDRVILNDVSLSLLNKERVAVVGDNGAGKSSLLGLLGGKPADSGDIKLAKGTKIALLEQTPRLNNDLSVLETMQLSMASHLARIQEHEGLCQQIASLKASPMRDQLAAQLDKLARLIEQKGGFDITHRIDTVLTRLGIQARGQKLGTLSGGEKRRVDLARILLAGPDIYLLDEPTNHLDIAAIQFLVETFSKSQAGIIFVSHDSLFIDDLATSKIIRTRLIQRFFL